MEIFVAEVIKLSLADLCSLGVHALNRISYLMMGKKLKRVGVLKWLSSS